MMADLYRKNPAFADSKWYRYEKRQIIRTYVNKLRSGKIMVNGDNLTICSNPYALLLYAAGGDWKKDPTLLHEDGTIQCYTSRFGDGEFLCAFRSPHNSPNNICYLHNHYSPEMDNLFSFQQQYHRRKLYRHRYSGQRQRPGSRFGFFLRDRSSHLCQICGDLLRKIFHHRKPPEGKRSNLSQYPLEYARMDNKFALSRRGIGNPAIWPSWPSPTTGPPPAGNYMTTS